MLRSPAIKSRPCLIVPTILGTAGCCVLEKFCTATFVRKTNGFLEGEINFTVPSFVPSEPNGTNRFIVTLCGFVSLPLSVSGRLYRRCDDFRTKYRFLVARASLLPHNHPLTPFWELPYAVVSRIAPITLSRQRAPHQ